MRRLSGYERSPGICVGIPFGRLSHASDADLHADINTDADSDAHQLNDADSNSHSYLNADSNRHADTDRLNHADGNPYPDMRSAANKAR